MKPLALAGAALLLALLALAAALLGPFGRGEDAEGAGRGAELERIRVLLERIADRLDAARPARLGPDAGGSPAASVASGDPAAPAASLPAAAGDPEIEELRAAIEAEGRATRDALARLGNLEFQSLDQVRAVKFGVDAGALAAFAELYDRDRASAVKPLRLLSYQELLARFGPPDAVNQPGSNWTYYLPPGNEENPDYCFEFQFGAGYVTDCWVTRRRN